MIPTEPFQVLCTGGLDLVSNDFELLNKPNYARELQNFEVATEGGYRLVNGFTLYGEGSATRPGGANPILGVVPYALGVVVCVSTDVYYSEDGITWLQINKDTGASGVVEGSLGGLSTLTRSNQAKAQFAIMTAPNGRTDATYGSLNIATGPNKVARFRIDGVGAGRTFHYEETSTPAAGQYIETHETHMCIVDTENAPSTVYYSAYNDDSDFAGSGSGSITIPDRIVGIKSFRDFLYVFCERSIHKISNLNDITNIAREQVTEDLGCVSGYTVQEIGGDLVFLSTDGIRNIAGTERIDDVSLSALSNLIKPLVEDILNSQESFDFSSVVIEQKDQYRLFYSNVNGSYAQQKGIIGTLRPNDETGQLGFEWTETKGIEVSAIHANLLAGNNSYFHGDFDGYVYCHDTGTTFNGTDISYRYVTPDFSMGDSGLRKTLHYLLLSSQAEGANTVTLNTKFDFSSSQIIQPPAQTLTLASTAGAVYGTAVYGTSTYSSTSASEYQRVNLIGSGTSLSFRFTGTSNAGSFIFNGFYITYVPHDRR